MPLGPYQSNTGITLGTILQPSEDSIVGYFVEVDLNYPSHVHDCHNGLPLAPEKVWLATTLHLLGFLHMQFLLRRNLDQKNTFATIKDFCETSAPSFKGTSCLRDPAKHFVRVVHREEHHDAQASCR